MSLFKTLSGVFQPGKIQHPSRPTLPKPKRKPKKPKKPKIDPNILIEAQSKAREVILEAKDQALQIRSKAEQEARRLQNEFSQKQLELSRKESDIARLQAANEGRENFLKDNQTQLNSKLKEVDNLREQYSDRMQKLASLTKDEAKDIILKNVEKRLTTEVALSVRAAEEKAREEADDKAREIIIDALKHGATDYVAEYTVSTVTLPNEESKGRIIGKEGRNIRAFEQATGVDVDLDETPGEVRISSFDPVRRVIAKTSLTRLLADGRIQPTRIEEYVTKTKTEIEKIMFEEGKKLCHEVGVFNLPRDIIAKLGEFKYRFSYGQNMIAHTLEETKIGIALAHEVGANADIVRLGCLLHDIGKVIHDEDGGHVELGVKLLKKFNIPNEVVDCVEQHHEDKPFSSAEAVIVYVADAISGARPGARYENYEEYVKRLTKLEEIATSYEGVKEAFAIQAGREVRVIVKPDKINDDGVNKLAFDIKERVRNEMTYPGTVTVTVVRETRAQEVAK
ncbi:ribonuclease Y [Pseudomonadota bacterium]